MSLFKKLFGKSNNKDNPKKDNIEEEKSKVSFELNIGEYIEDSKYGIGRLLSVEQSDEWVKYSFDFDLGTRDKTWSLSDKNSDNFKRPEKSMIDSHLQYRNYELGENRYLKISEMENLKEGDLVLRNRKGFARILSFGRNEKGNDIMNLEYLETGERNTFNRYDSGGALVRFSFNHNLNNEFWEKIEDGNKTISIDEVEMLEKELDVNLPNFYKSFLLNYPNELLYYNRKRLNRKEKFFKLEVLINIDDLRNNQLYFEEFGLNEYWPIGSDGIGNYYAVKKNGEDEHVYFIDHEVESDKSVSVLSKNLEEFTTQLIMREMENSYQMINK
jgi:hypothetical protein